MANDITALLCGNGIFSIGAWLKSCVCVCVCAVTEVTQASLEDCHAEEVLMVA